MIVDPYLSIVDTVQFFCFTCHVLLLLVSDRADGPARAVIRNHIYAKLPEGLSIYQLTRSLDMLLYGHGAATSSAQMPKSGPNVAGTKQKSAHKKSAPSSALLVGQPCVFNACVSLPFLPVCTQRNHAVQRKGADDDLVFQPALPAFLRVSLQPFDVTLADFSTVEEIG